MLKILLNRFRQTEGNQEEREATNAGGSEDATEDNEALRVLIRKFLNDTLDEGTEDLSDDIEDVREVPIQPTEDKLTQTAESGTVEVIDLTGDTDSDSEGTAEPTEPLATPEENLTLEVMIKRFLSE